MSASLVQGGALGREQDSAETVLINLRDSGLMSVAGFDGGPRQAWKVPEPGERLAGGRFEVLRRLGEGGMGIVYEAFDRQRRGKVALKTLHRLEPAGIYQLKSEFRVLADVSHPNLVRLHELFADDQTWFFTMDLVEGRRFDSWFTTMDPQSDARWEQLREALAQLVEGVLAIHRMGKLHRDLKPSNVMVDRQGRVIVLDFGLATAPGPEVPSPALEAELSGTPAYMAPEQVLGVKVSTASDWYALGVMLFEVLTGHLPFRGSFTEMLIAKQLREAPPVSALAPQVPADLSALCGKLLAIEPGERPNGHTLMAEFRAVRSVKVGRASRPPEYHADLVGREGELERLREAYKASADSGRPVVVMLKGESGIGKSTLLARFLDHLRETTPAMVLRGRCYERESVPFTGFDAVVDDLTRHLKTLAPQEVHALMPREAWALTRLFPVLGRVSGFADLPARAGADPHEIRRRGFAALGELLSRVRDRTPLVLAVDDLHWADKDSIALLMHLVRQAEAPHLLFVGTCRDGDCRLLDPLYHKLPNDIRVSFREIGLEPLPAEVAVELVGRDAPQAVLREARGNPFLLRELYRHARDSGTAEIETRSLSEILWRRCAALPEAGQRLLHAIALSAGSVPLQVAIKAARVEPSATDALQDRQLVRRGAREGEVECYHDKIGEAVAKALPSAQARAMHLSLAAAWESSEMADPEQLSMHYEQAGEHQRAAVLCVDAAERAAQAFGFERAIHLFDKALELGRFDNEQQHRLLVARADMLAQAGRSLEAAEACIAARAGANPEEQADLNRRAGGFYLQCGRFEEAIPLVNQGLARYGLRLASTSWAAVASLVWQRARLKLRGYRPRAGGQDAKAVECFHAAEVISSALPSLDPVRYPALATRLLRLALDSGDSVLVARAMGAEVLVGLMLALPDDKLRKIVERAEALCAASGDPVARFWLSQSLATLELNDNPSASLRHLDVAREVLTSHPSPAISHLAVWLEWSRLQVLCLQGAFGEVAKNTPALLDDAWARDNRGIVPFLAGVPGAIARVAVEDLAGLRHDLDRSKEAWTKQSFTWQDIMQTQGEVALSIYQGSLSRALAATELLECKFSRSPARHAASVRGYVSYVSGWTNLARARELRPGSERRRLLDQAAAALRCCDSKRLAASWSSPLEPALEALRGDTDTAVRLLENVINDQAAAQRLPVYAVCAKRGLGTLLGGDRGRRLVAAADTFLRERGVVDPERFVGAIAPGLTKA